MGVGLVDDEVIAEGIELAALIADHHAGGNAGHAHEGAECGRIVLAKTDAAVEEKVVEPVIPIRPGGDGVGEILLAEKIEGTGHDGARRSAIRSP